MSLFIDTHKEIETLIKDYGFNKKAAEGVVTLLAKRNDRVATKNDLKVLKLELMVLIGGANGLLAAILKGWI